MSDYPLFAQVSMILILLIGLVAIFVFGWIAFANHGYAAPWKDTYCANCHAHWRFHRRKHGKTRKCP